MKATIYFFCFFTGCSLAATADSNFFADKIDPAAAGMNQEMLARIPVRMKEFVDAGKTAGVVMSRWSHGTVTSLALTL